MQAKSLKLLEDIRNAAVFIRDVTADKELEQYRHDRMLRYSIERSFEIVGEAIKRLVNLDQDTASRIADYRQIIAFRNVLIHGYDLVDHELVWSTIKNQVPVLLHDVESLLSKKQSRD